MQVPRLKVSNQRWIIWALGLHSAGIIAFQLVLMQLISNMQWYHFAYMVISIAMLGFGASGSILALFKKRLLAASYWLIPVLMAITGFFMIMAFILARLPYFQFDVYLMFVDKSQFGRLAANYLIYFTPFFSGALAIGLIFIKNAENIGKYYYSNLLGSGMGGILALILLSGMFPLKALPFVACIPLFASLLILNERKIFLQLFIILVSLSAIVFLFIHPGTVPMSQYKGLSKTLLLPEAEIIYQKPDIHGYIEVAESPALRYAPAISLSYTGEIPVLKNIFINGDFYAVIPKSDTTQSHIHDSTTEALPYIMNDRENVLVLKAGAGIGISHALAAGADNIDAVIEIKGVKELMEKEFAAESGNLFHNDKVNAIYIDSRQFLQLSKGKQYDAIILPRMESFGGSTGLNALQEEYALTIQAFDNMWRKLTPSGVIVVTSWMEYPPRTTLKILATLLETLKRHDIQNPEDHLVAIKSWGTLSFALKKTPVEATEIERIKEFCGKMFFDPVLLPGTDLTDAGSFNAIGDDQILTFIREIKNTENRKFVDSYDFYIKPATDNKPYFSRFLKAGSLKKVYRELGADNLPFLELGYLIVWVTLFQSILLAVVFIIVPLFWLKKQGTGKILTLAYFGALGLGFMFVEIIFIQRFILYFGHPVYAISAVISVMMIASGAGSLYSGNLYDPLMASRYSTLAISVLLLSYAVFLTPILTGTIQFPLFSKAIIALILIAIPSFFMGIPFPTGIRMLVKKDESQIPWAWGINGCLSVIATALATLIAVEKGFLLVMILSVALYLAAFAIFLHKRPTVF